MSDLLDLPLDPQDRLGRELLEDARALARISNRIAAHLEDPHLEGADARRLQAAWLAHRGHLERLELELEMTGRAARRQVDRQHSIGHS